MKKNIILFIIGLSVILISIIAIIFLNNNKVYAEIYKIPMFDENDVLIKKIKIKESQTINVDKYDDLGIDNNIKIISINDNYIEISRKAINYNKNNKEVIKTTKTKIKYNKYYAINIDQKDPNSTLTSAPKYTYSIIFKKN